MKAAVFRTFGLALVLSVLVAPGAGARGSGAQPYSRTASACAATSDSANKPRKPTKPSSFAPRGRAPNSAYGAPIQKPILKSHPKPKPHLKATPLQ